MTAPWVPPRRTYHLRILAVSVALIVFCLGTFLFVVRMEAIVPATGTITARDLHEVRSLIPGLVEPGWYEVDHGPEGTVRLDGHDDRFPDPGATPQRAEDRERFEKRQKDLVKGIRFHRLQPGDELWPGQVVAIHRSSDLRAQQGHTDSRIKELESRGESTVELRRERDRLREQIAQTIVHVPDTPDHWLVLEVRAAQGQAVQAGDVIATIVPIDPETHQPRNLVARLDVDEKFFGELTTDQPVRIYSNMYNHRLRGYAEACIEKLEPLGEATASGERRFHAVAPITAAPFALPIGSTFKAEVVVGRKLVYRIILEH